MTPRCRLCGKKMVRRKIDGVYVWQCPKPDCLYVMPIDSEGEAPRRK